MCSLLVYGNNLFLSLFCIILSLLNSFVLSLFLCKQSCYLFFLSVSYLYFLDVLNFFNFLCKQNCIILFISTCNFHCMHFMCWILLDFYIYFKIMLIIYLWVTLGHFSTCILGILIKAGKINISPLCDITLYLNQIEKLHFSICS